MPIPTGLTVKCVVIESDGKNELHESVRPKGKLEDLSSEEIIEIIRKRVLLVWEEQVSQPM